MATKMMLFGSFAMGTPYTVRFGPQAGTTGLIWGIKLESGYELGDSPNHFLVSIRTAAGDVECYVRTSD